MITAGVDVVVSVETIRATSSSSSSDYDDDEACA